MTTTHNHVGRAALALAALILLAASCAEAPPDSSDDPPAPPSATQEATEVVPTPTAAEALRAFTFCDRLLATASMLWGQSPDVIYSGDPRITGNIEDGDYVRILTPNANPDGAIRVKVFPHDGRAVGNTDDQVWIDWRELIRFRLDQVMFTCQD